jgi:hypothetical protein
MQVAVIVEITSQIRPPISKPDKAYVYHIISPFLYHRRERGERRENLYFLLAQIEN